MLVDRNIREPTISVVAGSVGFNRAVVQWDDVISAMSEENRRDAVYDVVVVDDSRQSQKVFRTTNTQYNINVLLPDRRYTVKCRVSVGPNVTSWSQCSFMTKPIPVANVVAIPNSIGFNSFSISWDDCVDRQVVTTQEQIYTVQVATGRNNFADRSTDAPIPFKIDGIEAGSETRVRVKLVLIDSESGERVDGQFSQVLTVRTFSVPVPRISFNNVSFKSMDVSCASVDPLRMLPSGVSAGVYNVEWKRGAAWTSLYNGSQPVIHLQDLAPGTAYYFRARYALSDRTGEWSEAVQKNTTSIPVPKIHYDPVSNDGRISCAVTNARDIERCFNQEDFAKLRYQYSVIDTTAGGRESTYMINGNTFTKSVTSLHDYNVKCRICIGGDAGPWSSMQSLSLPESTLRHCMGVFGKILASFLWELAIFVVLFALLLCLGYYIDSGDEYPISVCAVLMLIVFGSIFLLPIFVLNCEPELPPLTGLFMLPLTKLNSASRNAGANFYCVMLVLQYIGIVASLILLLCRTSGMEEINLFEITIPVAFSFTIIPAITVPALFLFGSKGRVELLFVYSLLFPFWLPVMLISAFLDGIVDLDLHLAFFTMYLAFGINALLVVIGVCMAGNDVDEGVILLAGGFAFGIPVSVPTFLIMPIIIACTYDPEADVDSTYMDAFAPLYIDCIIACGISILSHCVDEFKLKNFAKLVRLAAKSANLVYLIGNKC